MRGMKNQVHKSAGLQLRHWRACVGEMPRRWMACAVAMTLATGCNSNGTGICFEKIEEPLISVVEARDLASGTTIPEVTIRNPVYMGAPLPISHVVVNASAPVKGIVVEGQLLKCQIVCTFGSEPGEYQFTFGAAGYRDTTLTLQATYSVSTRGCQRFLNSATSLSLRLNRL